MELGNLIRYADLGLSPCVTSPRLLLCPTSCRRTSSNQRIMQEEGIYGRKIGTVLWFFNRRCEREDFKVKYVTEFLVILVKNFFSDMFILQLFAPYTFSGTVLSQRRSVLRIEIYIYIKKNKPKNLLLHENKVAFAGWVFFVNTMA